LGVLPHDPYEVALTTTSGFIFSLPAALSFTPFGLSYSAFSTISSFTSSAVSCASSNKLFISPNDKSFSAKFIPYLVDSVVAFSTISSFSFHSIHSLTEVALNIKKTALVVSSVVSADHITKSLIELFPDEPFKYLDSFFGFENNIDSNNPDL
jgi:predicted metalloprotease with PDZ domain